MNSTALRVLKGVAAVAVLLALLGIVWGWWGEYRSAPPSEKEEQAAEETTGTAEGEEQASDGATEAGESESGASKPVTTVVVLTEGLNFRKQPATNGDLIDSLKKGQKLVLIKKQEGWLQVKTTSGTTGWVSADPRYTEIKEP